MSQRGTEAVERIFADRMPETARRIGSADDGKKLPLTPIIFGAGTFGHAYNDSRQLAETTIPEETIRRAFASGINAIDTSPYYRGSEAIIGNVLGDVNFRQQFPRHKYHILTKAGRYGADSSAFDYSANRIKTSVKESLRLLKTDYLDVVYLHDVEFVAEDVEDANAAGLHKAPRLLLNKQGRLEEKRWGLSKDMAGIVHGDGDRSILEAAGALFELKDKGLIRRVGISGLPLPTILRLARLILYHHKRPLDIVLSYAHHSIQNDTLGQWLPMLFDAGLLQVVNASPFSMGMLTRRGAPDWHPAPAQLRQAVRDLSEEIIKSHPPKGGLASDVQGHEAPRTTIERVALAYGLSSASPLAKQATVTAVGFSSPEEVEEALAVYELVYGKCSSAAALDEMTHWAVIAQERLTQAGFQDWIWAQPDPLIGKP
ncbi:uncharacterized protein L969DRAFT_96995 [Mixia osmundae IAM 14324]|uniref:NADP-dependent oxidoreductase domain-containing protein n=1 Tax=Mixia osmundae (strain CBS 9802 / IAM 14324 / JCM 22182 / KY 12970) TaxID=764103 RepID=G7E2Q4_MIXOS|nr:uncharacterized protein L969DRAFT_96995 [Mixia osmundae IAM 14324]KEI36979.1 hypothetical protein L969DRAFT_96995 [Mixia osmundae IAM 14324]GAA97114.1 hypothetical protein E5Q_03789 [Mixia osmundae IAM 14324]